MTEPHQDDVEGAARARPTLGITQRLRFGRRKSPRADRRLKFSARSAALRSPNFTKVSIYPATIYTYNTLINAKGKIKR